MIDSALQAIGLTVDLHKGLIEAPLPLGARRGNLELRSLNFCFAS